MLRPDRVKPTWAGGPRRPPARVGWALLLAGAALLLAGGGCTAGDVYRKRLRSPNALERAKAAVALAEMGDAQAVHHLVDLLEDRDPGVRFFAISALQRLCGTDRGYRYYHGEQRRAVAVRSWRDALRDGELVVRAAGTATGKAEVGERRADPPVDDAHTDHVRANDASADGSRADASPTDDSRTDDARMSDPRTHEQPAPDAADETRP